MTFRQLETALYTLVCWVPYLTVSNGASGHGAVGIWYGAVRVNTLWKYMQS
jgi:hypothetical protein